MGEVEVQRQYYHQEQPFMINTGNSPKQEQLQQRTEEMLQLRDPSSVEPIDHSSMLHLNSANAAAATCCHYHHHHHNNNLPCAAAPCAGSPGSNSMKRRSPATSSGERSSKKLFCDQEDLTLHGFSAISLPVNVGAFAGNGVPLRRCASGPCKSSAGELSECPAGVGGKPCCQVLQRCASDPSKALAVELPECITGVGGNPVTPPSGRGKRLPPLPRGLQRTVSDVTPSPAKALSPESSKSSKLRRMKDRLKVMKQWWDVAMQDAEEDEEEEEDKEKEELVDCVVVAKDDKIPSQDDELGGAAEEAISVEWIERCLSLTFRCPCGKGYEVLLSENNCYYKLV